MTFSVIKTENQTRKVVGTVWASRESEAVEIASGLWQSSGQHIEVKATELREVPLDNATRG